MHDHMRSKFAQRRFDAYVPFDGRGDWRGLVLQRNDGGGHVLLLREREGGREIAVQRAMTECFLAK